MAIVVGDIVFISIGVMELILNCENLIGCVINCKSLMLVDIFVFWNVVVDVYVMEQVWVFNVDDLKEVVV